MGILEQTAQNRAARLAAASPFGVALLLPRHGMAGER